MAKKRRRYYTVKGSGYPRYNSPNGREILLVLFALAVMVAIGTIAGSSETVQTMAHGNATVTEVQP